VASRVVLSSIELVRSIRVSRNINVNIIFTTLVTPFPGSLSQSTPNNSSPSSGLNNHVVGNFAAVAAANTQPNSTSSKNTCKYEARYTTIAHTCTSMTDWLVPAGLYCMCLFLSLQSELKCVLWFIIPPTTKFGLLSTFFVLQTRML
jgi:hypothetical protein